MLTAIKSEFFDSTSEDDESQINYREFFNLSSQMLKCTASHILLLSVDGNCLFSNRTDYDSINQIFDASSSEPLDQHIEDPEIRSTVQSLLTNCMQQNTSVEKELTDTGDDKNGLTKIELTPWMDSDNQLAAAILVLTHSTAGVESDRAVVGERFIRALDFFSGAVALYDDKDRKLVFNKTYAEIHSFLGDDLKLGMTFQECVRLQIDTGLIKDAIGREEEFIAKRTDRFRNPSGPFEVRKPGEKWYRITEERLQDGGCLQTMEDISEMKRVEIALRESESRFRGFAESAAELFWETDENLKISFLSDRYQELTGDSPSNMLGYDFRDTHLLSSETEIRSKFAEAFEATQEFDNLVVTYSANEEKPLYFSLSGRPYFDEDETLLGYRGVARDITQARQLTDQLNYQARYDSLTNLVNRREFNERITLAQQDLRIRNIPTTLGFIDLDQFKVINDTEGHPAGDRLLQEVSTFLKSKLRDTDVLARLGGDEFGLLVQHCSIEEGTIIVENLVNSLEDFNFISRKRVYGVTASVGLVEINDADFSREELMRQVDIACYAAKDLGRNQVHVYGQGDDEQTRRSQEVLHAAGIHQALAEDRFVLHAQPISICGKSASDISHYEILLRMLDEQNNELSPASFIPVAERYRLMTDIDRWVVHNSFKMLRDADANFDNTHFTINLSGASFTDATLAEFIENEFKRSGVAPERIVFEITETAVVASVEKTCEFIDRLTKIGCRFAIDDFGSGMSSFAYLKRFQADYLKIDGSLILEVATEKSDRTMVSAINEMAHVLGMKTIAEFVENDKIIETLNELGVDMLQGFGIGRPKPLSTILN